MILQDKIYQSYYKDLLHGVKKCLQNFGIDFEFIEYQFSTEFELNQFLKNDYCFHADIDSNSLKAVKILFLS